MSRRRINKKPRQDGPCRHFVIASEGRGGLRNRVAAPGYSLTADASSGSATPDAAVMLARVDPLGFAAARGAFSAARSPPSLSSPLLDSTKSAIRGAISARKRDPLNTP